jgi:hypothetical protein
MRDGKRMQADIHRPKDESKKCRQQVGGNRGRVYRW